MLEISSFIAASATGAILSDFGADVIKIEPPEGGDRAAAKAQYPSAAINYGFQADNRNKRSLGLDLKSKPAKDVMRRLVKWADVLITNCPPKVKASLGLTYEVLSAANPRLIYADVTGYGANGPEADRPGFDVVAYWGRSAAWQGRRNKNHAKADWQFTAADARVKLKQLYPAV